MEEINAREGELERDRERERNNEREERVSAVLTLFSLDERSEARDSA